VAFPPFNVLVIGGPTASGKSGLALSAALASATGGCIINADSMQLYDGLPLLTAQPDAADRGKVPHRLYGVLQPEDACTAARWREMALEEIDLALANGYLPIIVGGTGFYIRTLLEGISPVPEVPADLRAKLAARHSESGTPALFAELARRDPETALGLDRHNSQRVLRAMEVLEFTGKGLAEWQALPKTPPPDHLKFRTALLLPPREALYARCDQRFDAMLAAGALEEVKAFRPRHVAPVPLHHALGYAELCRYMDGEISVDEAAVLSKNATRQYAKRQMTWFRHQMKPDITLDAPDAAALLAA